MRDEKITARKKREFLIRKIFSVVNKSFNSWMECTLRNTDVRRSVFKAKTYYRQRWLQWGIDKWVGGSFFDSNDSQREKMANALMHMDFSSREFNAR